MHIGTAREFFGMLASRGHDPRVVGCSGTWQFDVDGVGTWQLSVDHGAFSVEQGTPRAATTEIKLSEAELVRLANGDGHENLQTALLRGGLRLGGDFRFGQRLQSILPVPDDWRNVQ
jgi:hypothetical protein